MRPTWDQTYINLCLIWSRRSTCLKAACGCILVDSEHRELAQGFNGVARGAPHCNRAQRSIISELVGSHPVEIYVDAAGEDVVFPNACPGHNFQEGSDTCQAVHAEVNALLKCKAPDDIHTVYSTLSPCYRCMKDLLNTGAMRMVWQHPHGNDVKRTGEVWCNSRAGRTWERFQADAQHRIS